MHISPIDAPSDIYGAVTDVSRPLIYKLNQASMQRSVYDSLHVLLVWALANLEQGVTEGLIAHERTLGYVHVPEVEAVVQEIAPTEPAQDATSGSTEGGSDSLVDAPATGSENVPAEEVPTITVDAMADSAEDVANAEEIAAVVVATSTRVAKPT